MDFDARKGVNVAFFAETQVYQNLASSVGRR